MNPTFKDCEKLIQLVLIEKVKWFYSYVGLTLPPKIQNTIDNGVTENDLPKFSEWYSFEESLKKFTDRTARYFLVVFPNFRQTLSEYELNLFVKSRINWDLIVDFENETQQKGLEKAFKSILGQEKMRTLTKGNDIPDFKGLYYFLAQGSSSSDQQNNIGQWKNSYGKTLEKVLKKIEAKKAYIVIIGNEPKFISKTIEVVFDSYSSITKTHISLEILVNTQIDKQKIEELLNDEGHHENFLSINYHLFDFQKVK